MSPVEIGPDGSPIVTPNPPNQVDSSVKSFTPPNPNPISPISPVGGIPPNPHFIPPSSSDKVDPTTIAIQRELEEKDRNSVEGTKESEKEMIARLEREAKGQAVPVPTTAPNILTMSLERKLLLKNIQEALLEYDNKESEIPLSHNYWDWLNRFRAIK